MSFQPQDSAEYLESLLASGGNPQQEVEGYLGTPVNFQSINYNTTPVYTSSVL